MDEQFHQSGRVGRTTINALIEQASDGPALRRFATQYALLVGSSLIVVLGPVWGLPSWTVAPALLVFALMTMAMFAVVHESGHLTAFRTRGLNRLVCWLAAAPIYYAPTIFREFHFTHHRYTHDPTRDPEISIGGRPAPSVTSSLIVYTAYLTGAPLLFFKVAILVAAAIGAPASIWTGFLCYVGPRARRRARWEARAMLSLHVLWVAAGIFWLPGLLTLLLGQLLGHALLAFYLTGEHNGLPHEGGILARTRTTLAPPALKWLMWNMPYHAEHHAWPAVPWHALPALHQAALPELRHVGTGYLSFHRRVLASLLRGLPYREQDEAVTARPGGM